MSDLNTMKRTYENALRLLESRRRSARPKDLPALRAPLRESVPEKENNTTRGIPSIVGMKEWLQVLGHSDDDLNKLNVIHIAGTKGKGSTCAFVRSLLHAHGARTGFPQRIGLYTSPDLRNIRERIQINGRPIVKDLFTKYFFEVWDRLSGQSIDVGGREGLPRFLQLLALVAFHTFISEKMEATIIETHHGGEYDSTNVVSKPAVTGLTPIGMDHLAQLGPTMENIAWHKSGIFKAGVPALSTHQEPITVPVLKARAEDLGAVLRFIPLDNTLPEDARAFQSPVQRINCSLAIAIVGAFLDDRAPATNRLTLEDQAKGIGQFTWPGRFETIIDGRNEWFLDGAHNELSIAHASEWFARCVAHEKNLERPRPRVVIFSHISEERDGAALMDLLASWLIQYNARPNYVIFTTYQERRDGTLRLDKTLKPPEAPPVDIQAIYMDRWRTIQPEAILKREDSIEGALDLARKIGEMDGGDGMQTLVTGSLHLVGGALNLLDPLE